jgi:hypothetical protein
MSAMADHATRALNFSQSRAAENSKQPKPKNRYLLFWLGSLTGFAVFQAHPACCFNLFRAEQFAGPFARRRKCFPGRLCMPACNRLRIDPGNGSPAVDYRIESDFVESRTLEPNKQWQRLTPEQLTSRVMADKVVAQWLRHRMGLHRLVRACQQDDSSPHHPALENSQRTAA